MKRDVDTHQLLKRLVTEVRNQTLADVYQAHPDKLTQKDLTDIYGIRPNRLSQIISKRK